MEDAVDALQLLLVLRRHSVVVLGVVLHRTALLPIIYIYSLTQDICLYLSDDGIIGGGDLVEDAVDALQLLLVLRRHAVVVLGVVLH